jgi:hypothetical protein
VQPFIRVAKLTFLWRKGISKQPFTLRLNVPICSRFQALISLAAGNIIHRKMMQLKRRAAVETQTVCRLSLAHADEALLLKAFDIGLPIARLSFQPSIKVRAYLVRIM